MAQFRQDKKNISLFPLTAIQVFLKSSPIEQTGRGVTSALKARNQVFFL